MLAIVLADAGVSGMVAGPVIQSANSVATGVRAGEIAFVAVGLVVAAVLPLRRRWLRRKLERSLAFGG